MKDLGIIEANQHEIKKLKDEISHLHTRIAGNTYLIDYLNNMNDIFNIRINSKESEIEILEEI